MPPPDTQLRPGARAEARRVQLMMKMKLVGSSLSFTRHTAEARCRADARRVQSMVKMKLAGSLRASTRHPAEARCPGGCPQSAVDGEDEAGGLHACLHPGDPTPS